MSKMKYRDPTTGEWKPVNGGGGGGTDLSLGISGAAVGQTVRITAVDEDGKPTAWEAVDVESGAGETWELICDVTFEEETNLFSFEFSEPQKKIRVIVDTLAAETAATHAGFSVRFNNEAGTVYKPEFLLYPKALPQKNDAVSVYDIKTYYAGETPFVDIEVTYMNKNAAYIDQTETEKFFRESITEMYYGKMMIPEIISFSQTTYGTFAVGTRYRIYGVRA